MLDWDDLRFFLAVARAGTLSAAGRELSVSQPTVGRRILAFEERLGAQLFTRTRNRLVLTAIGERLVANVTRMETEALEAERATRGHDEGLRGTVRITTTEWIAVRLLAPALAPVLARNSRLAVELLADPRHRNLTRRDADIAIRPSAYQHQSIYQRRIGRAAFALYASREYIASRGGTRFDNHGDGHTLIAMSTDIGDATRGWLDAHADRCRIALRTNGREQMATLCAAGIGVACLPCVVGDAHPELRRLSTPSPLPVRPLWLGVHRDVREIPRVRAVITALSTAVAASTAVASGA